MPMAFLTPRCGWGPNGYTVFDLQIEKLLTSIQSRPVTEISNVVDGGDAVSVEKVRRRPFM